MSVVSSSANSSFTSDEEPHTTPPAHVITRLYNMWAGIPDPTIDRNPAVLEPLRRFASRRPFFKGVAPPGHPYSWLFDGIECKDAPHLSLDELRHDQAFREELGLVVQSLQKDTTDVKNRLGGSPWDVWRLSLLEADRKRLEAASVYFVATSCQRKDDRDHKIIYASSWIEKLTGFPPSDFLGRDCRFLQGPDTDMRQVAKIRKALDKQQSITVVLLNYKKDRTPFWNLLSIDPLRDTKGGVVGFIGVQKNVSDIVHFYKRRVKPSNRTSTRPGEMGHLMHPHAAGACEALLNGTTDDAARFSEGKGDTGAARPSFNYSFGQAATGPPPAHIPGSVSSLPSVSLPCDPIPLDPMEPMEYSGGSTTGSMGGSGEGSTVGSSGGNDQTQSLSSSRSVDSEFSNEEENLVLQEILSMPLPAGSHSGVILTSTSSFSAMVSSPRFGGASVGGVGDDEQQSMVPMASSSFLGAAPPLPAGMMMGVGGGGGGFGDGGLGAAVSRGVGGRRDDGGAGDGADRGDGGAAGVLGKRDRLNGDDPLMRDHPPT